MMSSISAHLLFSIQEVILVRSHLSIHYHSIYVYWKIVIYIRQLHRVYIIFTLVQYRTYIIFSLSAGILASIGESRMHLFWENH